ncbi:MAG: hypothetical protein HYW81_02300 [Parcubacteria group bacterium]|nr:hypothetical protein [Parcubacteria group bacterium]
MWLFVARGLNRCLVLKEDQMKTIHPVIATSRGHPHPSLKSGTMKAAKKTFALQTSQKAKAEG